MTEEDITELAAILVNEHGSEALDVAEQRRQQHADKPRSAACRLWTRIANAVARLMRPRERRAAKPRARRTATRLRFAAARRREPS